jgi:hypothetical protein
MYRGQRANVYHLWGIPLSKILRNSRQVSIFPYEVCICQGKVFLVVKRRAVARLFIYFCVVDLVDSEKLKTSRITTPKAYYTNISLDLNDIDS